jgi:hypothetical protein
MNGALFASGLGILGHSELSAAAAFGLISS